MTRQGWVHNVFWKEVSIAPLVMFRILFGSLMLVSIFRFWWNGWIESQFIDPSFHFKYFGFYWIPDPSSLAIYLVFSALAIAAVMVTLGLFYRWSSIAFFLLFTYIELIDATYYLNHYYFVSLIALIMVFLPANKALSFDVRLGLTRASKTTNAWTIHLIQFQLGVVYFMAGIAKLNADWLLDAMPLAIWLPSQAHLPLIGSMLQWEYMPYVMSWAGACYDLSIPFLLLLRPTRWLAYMAVIVFHLFTWLLFQIGMFPFIMIGATLIFFPASFHVRVLKAVGWQMNHDDTHQWFPAWRKFVLLPTVSAYVLIQLVFPLRNLFYDGDPRWHEQGYRFGWRVMLTEKAGYAQFIVSDEYGREIWVDNGDFLTPVQEKMMATQPDFMLQYAAFLKQHYQQEGVHANAVKADVRVTFNGRPSQPFIDTRTDLASLSDGWAEKPWILPLQ